MTFSPLNAPLGQGPRSGASPLQDAIQLLHFELPRLSGAAAPSGVLGSPTAVGAQLGNGGTNAWLLKFLQGLVPNAGQAAGNALPASVVYGVDSGAQGGVTSAPSMPSMRPAATATPLAHGFAGMPMQQDLRDPQTFA
jgi:hypothetical protein